MNTDTKCVDKLIIWTIVNILVYIYTLNFISDNENKINNMSLFLPFSRNARGVKIKCTESDNTSSMTVD